MKKTDFQILKLCKGEMNLYDCGHIDLYVYKNNDPLNDISLILAKGKRGVVIEPPSFAENIDVLERYIHTLGIEVEGLLMAYHMTGANFLRGVRRYSTRNAEDFGLKGQGKAMVDRFSKVFGAAFDSSINKVTDYIEGNRVTIAGIEFYITKTDEAFDIEIPEIKAKYIHMLGHDNHSFIGSASQIDAEILKLKHCIRKGYELILTSHYPPEDLADVRMKIAYLQQLKSVVAGAKSANEFRQVMKKEYPEYDGEHYLDMTAQCLFGKPA